MSNSAFFYVDGIPTKGLWIDIDSTTDTDDVLGALADAGFIPRDEDGEPDYGGDLLVACTDGELAPEFLCRHDTFDLDGLVEVLAYCERLKVSEEAVAAYLSEIGSWSKSDFENAYCGKYESKEAYAGDMIEECGLLSEVPDSLRGYFDYEKFARDLFINDYMFSNGHVFRNT